MTTEQTVVKTRRGRTERTPVGTRNILTVKGKDPNYEYRIVNDEGDRIAAFEDAGYEIVEASSVRVGDKRVNKIQPEGTKAQVSVGGGAKAYVMRITKEFYAQDQEAKLARIRQQENDMRPENGKLEIKQG